MLPTYSLLPTINYKHSINYLAHNNIKNTATSYLQIDNKSATSTILEKIKIKNRQIRITDGETAAGLPNGGHSTPAATGISINSSFSQGDSSNQPIHDCGATNTIFRESDSNLLDNIRPDVGMIVGLPNGDNITSAAAGILSNNKFSISVPLFSNTSLNRSLISTADYCNNGCTATFTATSATITHDASGDILSYSSKGPTDRLWPFDSLSQVPRSTVSNVVRHEINADFVAYSSASFFSPPDTSLANALTLGWLGNFPRLTATMLLANKPNSISTAKGHLQQTRQKNHSSTYNTSPQRVAKPSISTTLSELDSEDDATAHISDSNLVFTHISTLYS